MSEDWGIVTLPTSGDPEKVAIGRLKAASDMALKYYGTPRPRSFLFSIIVPQDS